jgi:hypothetical protein
MDVMIAHLDDLIGQTRYKDAALWVRNQLLAQRDEARERISKKQTAGRVLTRLGSWWALRQQVRELEAPVVAQLLLQAVVGRLAEFSEQSDRLAAAGKGSGTVCQNGPQGASHKRSLTPFQHPQDPHELRISGKLLRYTLELAPVAGLETPKPILKDFKRLQDALGLWHDYVVLSQRAVTLAAGADLAIHNLLLYQQVLDLSHKALTLAAHQLQRFATLWTHNGRHLKATIEGIFGSSSRLPPTESLPVESDPSPAPPPVAAEASGPANHSHGGALPLPPPASAAP